MHNTTASAISVDELQRMIRAGERPALVDVRTPAEFSASRVPGSVNAPLGSPELASIAQGRNGAVLYMICQSGGRSQRACQELSRAGAGRVVNVSGGLAAWSSAGFEVEGSARKVISLERQVRIAAGSLVLAGCVAGFLVHPGFYGLAAFVGAGLVFAGITDFCGMGLLLARMPWNQRG